MDSARREAECVRERGRERERMGEDGSYSFDSCSVD